MDMLKDHTFRIPRKVRRSRGINYFLEKVFLDQKLNNWAGYIIIAAVSAVFGYLIGHDILIGLSVFGLVIGLFVVIACLINTELGLYINIFYSFYAFHFSRFLFRDEFPVGVITDVLVWTTLLGMLLTGSDLKKLINGFTHNAVVVSLLVLVFYLFIELFNPYAHSFEGWFQVFRRFLDSLFLLFIAYYVFNSKDRVRRFIIVLFIACVTTAIYGCIQQWHGLFNFEIAWVTSDENRFGIFFQMGDFRKFSTMSDPTAFGVVMAAASIFFIIIGWNQKKSWNRLVILSGVVFMILSMAYSGTRTANIMVTGGIGMFILLTFNKKGTRIFSVFAAIVFLFFLYGPYVNSTILRFRSSFIGTKDESYKVREVNRAFIQPYIYSHPIGGGLSTTGAGGLRYSPSHFLAGFPPDSGYLKNALESGWIGLIIICLFYYIVMRYGLRRYFDSHDEKLKVICAGCICAIFSFYLAEVAQVAIGQITDIVVYYPMIALLLRMEYLDKKEKAGLLVLNDKQAPL